MAVKAMLSLSSNTGCVLESSIKFNSTVVQAIPIEMSTRRLMYTFITKESEWIPNPLSLRDLRCKYVMEMIPIKVKEKTL